MSKVTWLRQRPQNAPRWIGILNAVLVVAGANVRARKAKDLEARVAALEARR